eukprot:264696_1
MNATASPTNESTPSPTESQTHIPTPTPAPNPSPTEIPTYSPTWKFETDLIFIIQQELISNLIQLTKKKCNVARIGIIESRNVIWIGLNNSLINGANKPILIVSMH